MIEEVISGELASRWEVPRAAIALERLSGGLINLVYRARAGERTVIAKHAPPYVAAAPHLALSPHRLAIEAWCLAELGPGGCLAAIAGPRIRAPALIAQVPEHALILIEDLGMLPDLGRCERVDPELGRELGTFLARLHVESRALPDLAAVDNRDIQDTRYRTQHAQVGRWLAERGSADHAELGELAISIGRRLRARGPSLIMGDLWLPSLLVDDDALRVIDWEFAHAGSPAQDLGHLVAHLGMHERRADPDRAAAVARFRHTFLEAYAAASDGLSEAVHRDACLHAGCEILARVLGPFKDDLHDARRVDVEVEHACALLRGRLGLGDPAARTGG